MNFAQELLEWRNSETSIINCEAYITSMINKQVNDIITTLKEKTEVGNIQVKKFNKKDFITSLTARAKCKYQKRIDTALVTGLFMYALRENKHIMVVDDPINKDFTFIFYSNTSVVNQSTIFALTECWFSTIILPDFKKQYMDWHTTNVTFTSAYMHTYSYLPLVEFGYMTSKNLNDDIKKKIIELVDANGLECWNFTPENTFQLRI